MGIVSTENKQLFWLPFKISLAVNLFSVLFNVINDCDETYNYWEPLHFLVTHGKGGGFQTWEYSPAYSLRSYLYLWLFGWPAYLTLYFGLPNWLSFLSVRFFLAIISTTSLSLLTNVVTKCIPSNYTKHRNLFAFILIIFSSFSPGNFLSSTTLVPSGPCVTLINLMLFFWIKEYYFYSIGCVAIMSLIVWPFASVFGLPLVFHLIFNKKFLIFIKCTLTWGFILILSLLIVDSYYFGRCTLAPLNIIRYNILSCFGQSSRSLSQLYGIEPYTFYVKNYVLNHNVSVLFTMCLLILTPILFIRFLWLKYNNNNSAIGTKMNFYHLCFIIFLSLVLWNSVFFLQSHKEERFLFPCYPFIALGSTIFVINFISLIVKFIKSTYLKSVISLFLLFLILIIFLILSVSRIYSLIHWYSAPIYLIKHLPKPLLSTNSKSTLCLGRDWHYFPSRFILPGGGEQWYIQFLQSNFSGQLPGQYKFIDKYGNGVVDSTRTNGSQFNSANLEEFDRYSVHGLSICTFILDRDSKPGHREELYIANTSQWTSILNRTILEPHNCKYNTKSNNSLKYFLFCSVARAFYIPFVSERYSSQVNMHILANRNLI